MKPDAIPSSTLEYLDPVVSPNDAGLFVPAVANLNGKWIAFVDNGWKSFAKIGARLEQVFVQSYGIAGFRTYTIPTALAAPAPLLDSVVEECAAAIVGMAN